MTRQSTISTPGIKPKDTPSLFPSGPALIQLRTRDGSRWLRAATPERVIAVYHADGVQNALRDIENEAMRGKTAVGFVAYEAAPAFDSAFETRAPDPDLPLLWFGIYHESEPVPPPGPAAPTEDHDWRPSIDPDRFQSNVRRIMHAIERGETYQVNYTFRLTAPYAGDGANLFRRLLGSQPEAYAAFLDTGRHVICSVSPELFFRREGARITCRPMKGTVKRGRTLGEDQQRAAWLAQSEKNRAENIMIVDMIRNDLGRIAQPGTVRVSDPFAIERYPTLFQMTSTVEADTDASLPGLFEALFPCASITGAPKVQTMKHIARLEDQPRGVYTGAIGVVGPGRFAQFNVAIRTVVIDRVSQQASFGTGSGIVWDSDAEEEYRECATKALVLREPLPDVSLLASLRWDPGAGFTLWEEQVRRLTDSAAYFDIRFDADDLARQLADAMARAPARPHKVRVLWGREGLASIDAAPLEGPPFANRLDDTLAEWRIALAERPIDPRDRFLYHKTNRRQCYDRALADRPDCDDVILWNRRDGITETCKGNLVARLDGALYTPPVESGLLRGTFCGRLLDNGVVREKKLSVMDLARADELFMVNAVRGFVRLVATEKERKRWKTRQPVN